MNRYSGIDHAVEEARWDSLIYGVEEVPDVEVGRFNVDSSFVPDRVFYRPEKDTIYVSSHGNLSDDDLEQLHSSVLRYIVRRSSVQDDSIEGLREEKDLVAEVYEEAVEPISRIEETLLIRYLEEEGSMVPDKVEDQINLLYNGEGGLASDLLEDYSTLRAYWCDVAEESELDFYLKRAEDNMNIINAALDRVERIARLEEIDPLNWRTEKGTPLLT